MTQTEHEITTLPPQEAIVAPEDMVVSHDVNYTVRHEFHDERVQSTLTFKNLKRLGAVALTVGASFLIYEGVEFGMHIYHELGEVHGLSLKGGPPHGTAQEFTGTLHSTQDFKSCSAKSSVDTGVNVSSHFAAIGGWSDDTLMPMTFRYCGPTGIEGNIAVGEVKGVPESITVVLAQYQKTDVNINWFSSLLCGDPTLTAESTNAQIQEQQHNYKEAEKHGTENRNCNANERSTGIGVATDTEAKDGEQMANELSEFTTAITPLSASKLAFLGTTARNELIQNEMQQYPTVKRKNVHVTMPAQLSPFQQLMQGYLTIQNEVDTHFDSVSFTKDSQGFTDLTVKSSNGAVGIVKLRQQFSESKVEEINQLAANGMASATS